MSDNMIAYIGEDVIVNGKLMHVQDTDYINQSAKVGIPDENGLIWETKWVPFSEVSKNDTEK